MRRNLFVLTICLFASLLFGACTQSQNSTTQTANVAKSPDAAASNQSAGKAPPADVVRVEPSNVEIKSGSSADAIVKLTVANGYHINANPPSFSYLKATELLIEPSMDISPGVAVYPQAVTRKFAFTKDPLAVYEGEVMIKQPLTAATSARVGKQNLKAELRIQACDEEACYPPRTIETTIPVTVQ